jgi:ABC-type maltose transport system permease subunit
MNTLLFSLAVFAGTILLVIAAAYAYLGYRLSHLTF